ncbi:MAG: hypothetical protein R3E12_02635 [Candidatus Eisenbacteria bacterium]
MRPTRSKGIGLFELQMFDPETSRATLRLANLDYARLIEQVNS